ncbi:MAG: hypothetical protein ABEJ05_04140 [Haloglomus sp.]
MRDVVRWLARATRSLAVDVAGRERRRAARSRLRTLLVNLLAVGSMLLVAAVAIVLATLAVGVVLTYGASVLVIAVSWALLVSLLAFAPFAAMRTGAAVYVRLG